MTLNNLFSELYDQSFRTELLIRYQNTRILPPDFVNVILNIDCQYMYARVWDYFVISVSAILLNLKYQRIILWINLLIWGKSLTQKGIVFNCDLKNLSLANHI